ncbi:MAG: uroporphyrinogen-III synthase, partial [Phycisphaerales bacterium]|nr:uroporphyrinogen-III synthase [Phycisphaerales bacterium]MCI0674488.1 uroporphyrinogen-III synthase [Phycisphaerales bacterium]
DLCPSDSRADALCDALLEFNPRPQRMLFPCGTLALETIPRRLGAHGIAVTPLIVYRTTRIKPDLHVREFIGRGVDAILLASPSSAQALVESGVSVRSAAVICIGETTASHARLLGLRNIHVAAVHSDAGLVAATRDVLSMEAVTS